MTSTGIIDLDWLFKSMKLNLVETKLETGNDLIGTKNIIIDSVSVFSFVSTKSVHSQNALNISHHDVK